MSVQKITLESQIGIILVTYNRASYLKKTFSHLQKSPFVNCSITIFDNCSTDETPQICNEALQANLFKNLKIIRHSFNIGGNANLLKALQSAEFNYTWILADDDYIEPEGWDDVIEEILKGEVASIVLNSRTQKNHIYYSDFLGKHCTWEEILLYKGGYINSLSFLPNTINRLDHIRRSLPQSVIFCAYLHPHFTMHVLADKHAKYYCSKHSLILQGWDTGPLIYYLPGEVLFVRMYHFIDDRKLRVNAISQYWKYFGGKSPLKIYGGTFLSLFSNPYFNLKKRIRFALELFLFTNWVGRFYVLILFPLLFSRTLSNFFYSTVRGKKIAPIPQKSGKEIPN